MIVTLVGARPQFVKASVVSKQLSVQGINETIVHSGQHYDARMSDVFWDELEIPKVEFNLECGSGTQGKQTAAIIEGFEKFLLQLVELPKAVLLYGDTNSTLAGAIVASKLQVPIIHVEAGLRSFNRSMPEEINRIVTDHLSTLLFCPSQEAVDQLKKEGILHNVHLVGDVMYDAMKSFQKKNGKDVILRNFSLEKNNFFLLTIHRPSNTDNPECLDSIMQALSETGTKVLWPLHPRLKGSVQNVRIPRNVTLCEPLSYLEMLDALSNCSKVITDSGGLQKEAYWSRRPCVTLRNETEWVETLHSGWNILTGADKGKILDALNRNILKDTWKELYGEGTAAYDIAKLIKQHFLL